MLLIAVTCIAPLEEKKNNVNFGIRGGVGEGRIDRIIWVGFR